MATITHAGPKHRESEFQIVNGVRLTGSCGPNASASALWAALGRPIHTADVYTLMRHYGWCDPNGASTLVGLNAAIRQMGATVNDWVDWQASWPGWLAFFKLWLGRQSALVMETNNGQAFVDYLTGLGENASGLVHHFICVHAYHTGGPCALLGGRVLPEGFVCADGDNLAGGNWFANNFNAADTLQFYPLAVMAAAQPAGAIAVAVPGSLTGVPMFTPPAGWHDDGHTLTAPNGVGVVLGFRDYIGDPLNGWDPNDEPLAAQYHAASIEPGNPSIGAGDRQDFRMTSLGYTSAKGVYRVWVGQDLRALTADLATEQQHSATLAKQLADANTQLGDANATIQKLQAQIAQLEASQSDPQAQAAKALMTQLKATLAQF